MLRRSSAPRFGPPDAASDEKIHSKNLHWVFSPLVDLPLHIVFRVIKPAAEPSAESNRYAVPFAVLAAIVGAILSHFMRSPNHDKETNMPEVAVTPKEVDALSKDTAHTKPAHVFLENTPPATPAATPRVVRRAK